MFYFSKNIENLYSIRYNEGTKESDLIFTFNYSASVLIGVSVRRGPQELPRNAIRFPSSSMAYMAKYRAAGPGKMKFPLSREFSRLCKKNPLSKG